MQTTDRTANNIARSVVKAMEAKTGVELDLNLCLAIVGIIGEAIESHVSPLRAVLEAVERQAEQALRAKSWPDCLAEIHEQVDIISTCQRQLALQPAESKGETT